MNIDAILGTINSRASTEAQAIARAAPQPSTVSTHAPGFVPAREVPAGESATAAEYPLQCDDCGNLDMRQASIPDHRRRFFWFCRRGHVPTELGIATRRVLLRDQDCSSFEPFVPVAWFPQHRSITQRRKESE